MSRKRNIIVVGDKTDHGGTVITGTNRKTIHGHAVACEGDKVECPKCKGVFSIITTAPYMRVDDRQIAREGDRTECGAVLISVMQDLTSCIEEDRPPLRQTAPSMGNMAEPVVITAPAPSGSPLNEPLVQKILASSPNLRSDIGKLDENDWRFRYGNGNSTQGGFVTIDKSMSPLEQVRLLAHEVGHAKSGINPSPYKMDQESYVKEKLRGEGAAALNALDVREEILHAKDGEYAGMDIGITPQTSSDVLKEYTDAYAKRQSGKTTEIDAQRELGRIYGKYEHPNGDPRTYEKYYADQWEEYRQRQKQGR
jgi:uncharacterized Zn-binding protein involved in type VI secretion